MLRVETVINQPGEFKVFRECRHRDGTTSTGWLAMCKGIGNLPHYQSQAAACNHRYLEALSAVETPTPSAGDPKGVDGAMSSEGSEFGGVQSGAGGGNETICRGAVRRPHCSGQSQSRCAYSVVQRRPRPPASPQCRRGPSVEAPACPRLGEKGTAHAALASHGTRPTSLK